MGFLNSSTLPASELTPVTQTIYNISLGVANTEQSQAMPATIRGYLIRTRGVSDLKLTHVSGESGTKYVSIPGLSTYTDEKTYNNLTLYFQSPSTGDVVEIVTWS